MYYDDNNQKLADYMMGTMGYSYNFYSDLGKSHRYEPSSSFPIAPIPTSKTSEIPFFPKFEPSSPVPKMSKKEKAAYEEKISEQESTKRDEIFCGLLVLVFACGMGLINHLYMPQWQWWADALFVLIPALGLVGIIDAYDLIRPLRRTVTTIVGLVVMYLILSGFGIVPTISSFFG